MTSRSLRGAFLGIALLGGRHTLVLQESGHADQWEERKYCARGVDLIGQSQELNVISCRAAKD